MKSTKNKISYYDNIKWYYIIILYIMRIICEFVLFLKFSFLYIKHNQINSFVVLLIACLYTYIICKH